MECFTFQSIGSLQLLSCFVCVVYIIPSPTYSLYLSLSLLRISLYFYVKHYWHFWANTNFAVNYTYTVFVYLFPLPLPLSFLSLYTRTITCIFTFSRLLHQDRLIKTADPSPPPPPLRWTVLFTSYSAATTNPVYTARNAVTSQTRTTRTSPSPSPSRDVGRAQSTSRWHGGTRTPPNWYSLDWASKSRRLSRTYRSSWLWRHDRYPTTSW